MTAYLEIIAAANTPVLALGGRVTCTHASAGYVLSSGSEVPAAQGQVKPHHLRFWELEYELGTQAFTSTRLIIPGAERVAAWKCLLAPGSDVLDPNAPTIESAA